MDAGYCFCVYTLNRKYHMLRDNVTKHFNSTAKKLWGHEAELYEAEATTVTRPRPGFGPWGRGWDKDYNSDINTADYKVSEGWICNKLWLQHIQTHCCCQSLPCHICTQISPSTGATLTTSYQSVHARLQVSVCSSYNLLTSRHTCTHRQHLTSLYESSPAKPTNESTASYSLTYNTLNHLNLIICTTVMLCSMH